MRSYLVIPLAFVFGCIPIRGIAYDGEPISRGEAGKVLTSLLQQNLLLSTDNDSAAEKFYCHFAYEVGLHELDRNEWVGVSYHLQRDQDKYAILINSNRGYPLAYNAPNPYSNLGRNVLAVVDSNSRKAVFVPGVQLRFEAKKLLHFRVEAVLEATEPQVSLDFGAMIKHFAEHTNGEWFFSDTANQFTARFPYGVLRVRLPRDKRPGRFPIAAISLENTYDQRVTWSDFVINRKAPILLTNPELHGGNVPGVKELPAEVSEIITDPLKFVRLRHVEAADAEYLSLMRFLQYDLHLGPIAKIKPPRDQREEFVAYVKQYDQELQNESIDMVLAGVESHLSNWQRNESYWIDRKSNKIQYVAGYEYEPVAHYNRQRLGARLFEKLRRTLVEHAASERPIDSRCAAIRTLALLGIPDSDSWVVEDIVKRLEGSPLLIELNLIAFQLLVGVPVSQRDINRLREGIRAVDNEQDQLFQLSALCRIDRVESLEELISATFATEKLSMETRQQREVVMPMIMASREGRKYFATAVKTRSEANAANPTERFVMNMAIRMLANHDSTKPDPPDDSPRSTTEGSQPK